VYKLLNYAHIIIYQFVHVFVYLNVQLGHFGMPCVPAGMPLYSQLVLSMSLGAVHVFPSESTVQKSGHIGFSGGHAPTALD
jgi:hypothetical protein